MDGGRLNLSDVGGLRGVELVLDAVEAQNLVDGDDVQRAALEGDTVGLLQALRDHLVRALAVLVRDRIDLAGGPGADEQRTFVAPRHHARAGHAVRPELYLEAVGDLELVDRNLVDRRDGQRRCVRCQRRARHAGRLTLLPGGWRLLRLRFDRKRRCCQAAQAEADNKSWNGKAWVLHGGVSLDAFLL